MRSIFLVPALLCGAAGCNLSGSTQGPQPIYGTPTDANMVGAVGQPTQAVEAPPDEQPVEAAPDIEPEIARAAAALAKAIESNDTTAWERLAVMCDSFGHRLSGSPGLEHAIDWAVDTLKKDGFENARREKVMVPHWVRGEESATLLTEVPQELALLGLGMSVGTPRRGITAPVVVVDSLAALEALGEGAKGKIVLINSEMPAFEYAEDGSGNSHYGEAVQKRVKGASMAAALGAKALVIRSVTRASLRSPHTGTLRYDEDVKKIPAAALSLEDADLIARVAKRGEVKLELKMGAKMLKDAESANVVAELEGREKPDEIVIIGCHIDSWDTGQGAHDDGAGCLMAMEAARLLRVNELVPKRTIRVVLYTNEENGSRGAQAYVDAHGTEPHVAGIEADSGGWLPWGFAIGPREGEDMAAPLQPYLGLFEPFGIKALVRGGGGADIGPMMEKGMVGIAVRPDGQHYFDLHHSHADTVDKVVPEHLEQNAGAMALLAFILAERGV